jgi:arylsulfatase A-like enzyme
MPQSPVLHRCIRVLSAAALALTLTVGGLPEVQAQEKKPNILVIMGDAIGIWNIAEMLKPLGYATAQFGKNHLGDRDEFLPTNHGFDEFFDNLYHLNAEEEPENPDYPKDPEFRKKFGPRGVLKASTDGKIDDTGPLTRKRMETVDEEFLAETKDFIERQVRANKPFFVWFNTTRMHIFTHLKPASQGKTGLGIQGDGMVEHDGHVGELLKLLDDLKIADNTLVIYTTDNGAMKNMWPDGGISPFRSEKDTNWEGAVRVPCFARWPGVIKPGTIINGLFSAEDWLPTLVAAAGDVNIKEKLLKGHTAGAKTFKVRLDGYNQLPLLKGKVKESPRQEFVYFDDDGNLVAYRDTRFKYTFSVQFAKGMEIWRNPLTTLHGPFTIDLMADPFEYAVDGSQCPPPTSTTVLSARPSAGAEAFHSQLQDRGLAPPHPRT